MTSMKIVFLGCTQFSLVLLNNLLKNDFVSVEAIFSIPEQFNISYSSELVKISNYGNIKEVANAHKIPYFEVDSVEGKRLTDYKHVIEEIRPDLILVLGWYYMVPQNVRNLARLGAWGVHASLLPKYAGGAPLVWAIIEGQRETGVTLFILENGVDDGDIIEQERFRILDSDSIKEVYDKASICSESILNKVFQKDYVINPKPQDKSQIKVYPQRCPADGKIDWKKSATEIKNFIRAQTKPYPGAWTEINGKKIIIWDATITDI